MAATSNETSLVAVLRVRDEMSGQLTRPVDSLGKLQTGFADVQKAATKSMAEVKKALAPVSTGLGGLADGFDGVDKAQAKMIGRSAMVLTKLIGLQTVAGVLTDKLGNSELGHSVKVTSDALTTFGGIVALMPNQLGLAVGAAAGLAVGIAGLLEPSEKVKEALEKVNHELDALRKNRDQLATKGALNKISDEARQQAGFPVSDVDKSKRERDALLEKLVGLRRELDVMVKNPILQEGDESGKLTTEKLAKMRAEIEQTEQALKKANGELTEFERQAADVKSVADFTKTIDGLNQKSNESADAMDAGIITPAKEAAEQLSITDQKMRALFNIKDKLAPGQFDQFKTMFMGGRDDLAARVQAGKDAEAASREQEREAMRQKHEEERRALRELENEWGVAVPKAMTEYLDQLKTAKDFIVDMFRGLQSGLANMFSNLLSGGKSAKDAFKNLLKDWKRSFISTVSEAMSQTVMKQALGLFGMGGTAAGVPTVDARGGAGAASAMGAGLGLGGSGVSLGSAAGLSGATGLAIAGLGIAGAQISGQGDGTNRTQGALGGALTGAAAGAALGSVIPFVGTIVGGIAGALIGGISGWLGSSKKRRKKLREAREAQARYEAALAAARVVLKQDLRNRMGGGLATQDAASDIGRLFSEDLSASEIQAFGDPAAIAAREGEVNRQVNVGGITVNAQISGNYDVQRLAEDLAYHLSNQMGGPGGV